MDLSQERQCARAVTADRGYGQAAVERDLQDLGVQTVAIPRQATTSPARKTIEHGRGFRRLVKWRTGPSELTPPTFQVEVARPRPG